MYYMLYNVQVNVRETLMYKYVMPRLLNFLEENCTGTESFFISCLLAYVCNKTLEAKVIHVRSTCTFGFLLHYILCVFMADFRPYGVRSLFRHQGLALMAYGRYLDA